MPAYVGIGSNLDSPVEQVRRAFEALAALPAVRLIARSRLYRSPPLSGDSQPDYVNAAAGLLVAVSAPELLSALMGIERAHGRRRDPSSRWQPRTLDLDLLVFGDQRIATAELTVPHPGLAGRNFVLFPLFDVAPFLAVPGVGDVATLKARVDQSSISLEEA